MHAKELLSLFGPQFPHKEIIIKSNNVCEVITQPGLHGEHPVNGIAVRIKLNLGYLISANSNFLIFKFRATMSDLPILQNLCGV